MIYKIFRKEEWDQLRADGSTLGAPIDLQDGFIHFSTAETVSQTAALHFADQDELILAAVDPKKLGDDLKWDPSRGGILFPHLYRALNLDEVEDFWPLPLTGGRHLFPDHIL